MKHPQMTHLSQVDKKIYVSIQEYLQNRTVEEQCKKLDQVVVHITFFLLCANDVWRVIGSVLIHSEFLVEREEAKLEEVLDDNSDL